MEFFKKLQEAPRSSNGIRIMIASGMLALSSCGVIPQSMQRFDVPCDGSPVEAVFNKDSKAIFIADTGSKEPSAVVVSKDDNGDFDYSISPYYRAQYVEFVGPVSSDGSAGIDAHALLNETDIRIEVSPESNLAELTVTC